MLLEFKEYATEVDVDFVRKAVRAIGRCAIKLERAAERCISVLLELIKIKVNYVVQEAIIVIKDIFRRYPNTWVISALIYVIYFWNDQTIRPPFFVLHNKWCVIIMFLFLNIYRYECIIAAICESLDTLDEPEAKVLVNANLVDLLYFVRKTYFLFSHWCVVNSLGIIDLDKWRICWMNWQCWWTSWELLGSVPWRTSIGSTAAANFYY